MLERRLNLAFALLNTRQGAGWRSSYSGAWLRARIPGYETGNPDSARKLFNRDVKALQEVGFPIHMVRDEEGDYQYSARYEDHALPPIILSSAEATVLGLAGDLGRVGELASFTRSGWMKLAASGVERNWNDHTSSVMHLVNDMMMVAPDTLSAVFQGVYDGLRITFRYQPHRGAQPQQRTMDPWGLVAYHSKLFLVGFDVDRAEERCFRIFRVSNVNLVGPRETGSGRRDLREAVEESLEARQEIVSAVVRVSPDGAFAIRQAAQKIEHGKAYLVGVERDWLLRTCAGYGPDAVVLSPTDIREDVISLLRGETENE